MIMAVSALYLSNSTDEAYGAHQEHSFYAVDLIMVQVALI